ncbi:MAG: hypothetical protein GQ564_17970 [Bacteroidales bacterium]|nr:hypothetical protein [Bacteroidales bacterium]
MNTFLIYKYFYFNGLRSIVGIQLYTEVYDKDNANWVNFEMNKALYATKDDGTIIFCLMGEKYKNYRYAEEGIFFLPFIKTVIIACAIYKVL